jgi:hypothetical protein
VTSTPLRIIPAPGIEGPNLPAADDPEAVGTPGSGAGLRPGDMWRDHDCWAIVLPNRTVWYSGIASASGAFWTVTGEAPNLTVQPSINDTDPERPWHGWVRGGFLVDA